MSPRLMLLLLLSGCAGAPVTRGAAQTWAENCQRCHQMRSPAAFSDGDWQVIALHMRIRAGLTREETEAVTRFLQAGN